MSGTIIIYSSKTGFSQRYAQWLAEDLDCQALPFRDRKNADLKKYDAVILAGGLYAGKMSGLGWLKRQLPALKDKRVAAVAVGCAPVENPGLPDSMAQLFGGTPEIRGFYCQGGLDYGRMGTVDRAMMAAMRSFLKKKGGQEEALEVISRSFDGSKRSFLEPVVEWARQAPNPHK